MELSAAQTEAVHKIERWYSSSSSQTFRLFGYAGTGKTTLARHIVSHLGLEGSALYAAYTGKAAYVLRTKGCEGASTVHSLVYRPVEKLRAKLRKLRADLERETDSTRRATLRWQIQAEEKHLQTPDFILRDDSPLGDAPLLVLDEVSMVNRRMAEDLLSFGTKLLVLGDPAQLPSVEGGGYFINHAPDHLLTEVHRSALDSPVTRLATVVRNCAANDRMLGVTGADADSGRFPHLDSIHGLLSFDQIITFKNRDRRAMVDVVRALRGWSGPEPQPDDRIIVLANNPGYDVFNGQQLTITTCTTAPERPDRLVIEAVDDDGQQRILTTWASGFADLEGEKRAKAAGRDGPVAATFGQVITCHKAQGSQWDRVLVYDGSAAFGAMAYRSTVDTIGRDGAAAASAKARREWLYTAVTRASKQVVILGGGRWS